MRSKHPRRRHPCTCGTGTYCRRHLRYGVEGNHYYRTTGREPIDSGHRCGGGRRIVRQDLRST